MLKQFSKIIIILNFLFLFVSNSFATNTLKYIIYKTDDSKIGAINVLIRAGSIFDPKGEYGLAFIVSKLLKRGGTKHFSPNQLLNKLDSTGIELSTGCSKDFISINMKFTEEEYDNALQILKEVLLFPVFDKKEFLSVKQETISLITSYQNNNDYIALHNGAINLFKNSDYSHSSFGTKEDIKKITLKNIQNYYKKYFVPENIIISFTGNFNKKKLADFIKNNFKKSKKNFNISERYPEFSNKRKNLFKEKNLKQSYIYFLFPSYGFKNTKYYQIKLLSFILGGNLTSILAKKIRKEKGLAYSVFSTNYTMVNGGFFIIGMQTENSKAKEAINSIINILKKLKQKGISEKRLKLAKNYISGATLVSLQSLTNIASSISRGLFIGKPVPPWEYDIKKIKNVSLKSVNKIIPELFDFNRMIISVVGKK